MKKVTIAAIAISALMFSAYTQVEARRGSNGQPDRGQRGSECSQGSGGPHAGEKGSQFIKRILNHPDFAEKAGISNEQVTQLKDSFYRHEKTITSLKFSLAQARLDKEHLISSSDVDKDQLFALVDEEGRVKTEMEKEKLGMRLAFRDVLGAEKMKALHQEFRAKQRDRCDGKKQRPGQGRGLRGGGDLPQAPWMKDPGVEAPVE